MISEQDTVRGGTILDSEIGELRKSVGWEPLTNPIADILKNSYAHFSIQQNGKLIAFARVISDELVYGFIVDLFVHPDYQKQGIGKMLVKRIVSELKKDGLKLIQLTFQPELEGFYKACGFEILKAGSVVN